MSAPIDRQEIDRVLQLKRTQREARACYPCRQRKVKCDNSQPCRTCRRRGHPEICVYDPSPPKHGSARRASRRTSATASATASRDSHPLPASQDASNLGYPLQPLAQPPAPSQTVLPPFSHLQQIDSSRNYPPDGPESEFVYSGDNSVVSILRNRTHDANGSMAREVGSVLGLQNTYHSYPFMEFRTPGDRWRELLRILPQRAEVLKFFHFYRLSAYPFNPILVDIERFELDLCSYLNALASGELQDPSRISDRWASEKSVAHISLLLATLAAGAHYSDLEHIQRSELCLDFARRSFQALRLANFLFRPTFDIIQSLLILGNTLQNTGQSDSAWALLGSTVRLAQTIGLHTEKSVAHLPDHVKSKARRLWFTVVWQDSLLCLCYDRPPIVTVTGWSLDDSAFSGRELNYMDMMHFLCRIALDILTASEMEMQQPSRLLDILATVDRVCQRAQPHLKSLQECKTLQHNLEHLALKMHIAFAVSVVTRPALKRSGVRDSAQDILRMRAKCSLIDASNTFLEFQALSVVPLRTWSMVHTVISSTLLLCIWEETRNDAECRDLQQKVIEVFSAAGSVGSVERSGSENGQWLSERHIRALITLRNAVRTALEREKEEGDVGPPNNLEQAETFMPAFGIPNGFPDVLGQDFSPMSYLDSIMNEVPMFDLSQEIDFS
ncbi:Zn(II)2Cys6 transcription factor [Aspergillus fijiensis CBS 313.89]|uniref:Phenylacrylic acid decarboxylase n=1 Tax=Aspergillus fijiensis CBS 313.89 TaxID=1448319 RepID=A0A8G1RP44_9EURO|nr:phenylacrylic acid decarboxylase [Aspergillus fijiensis CBS 313.89]RAK74966.1 phenylacrylic acid decarboxylase [Aspergillus fijiensis CBS 313.89]